MEIITIFIGTFVITAIVGVGIQIFLYKLRKKHDQEFPIDWDAFESVSKTNNYNEIQAIGNKLIFNRNITTKHLKIIHQTAIELEGKHEGFKKMKTDSYGEWMCDNKKWEYNK